MIFVLPTSFTSFGARGRLRVRGFTHRQVVPANMEGCMHVPARGRMASHCCHQCVACQSTSTTAGNWDWSSRPLPLPRMGKLVPFYCCPHRHTHNASGPLPALPSALRKHHCALSPHGVIIVQPSFPAHGSDGVGTKWRRQTVSQGLVNISALAHRRLHFEPYTVCIGDPGIYRFFQRPVGCLLFFKRRLTPEISCQSTWSPSTPVKNQ